MKNKMRTFGLALGMLPVCLNTGTGQDGKQAYQSAELIPAGTILPVSLNSTLRSDKSGRGATITATIMRDVPLGAGRTLRAGSKVTGHVVDAIARGREAEPRISFQFDQVRLENRMVPITTNLRAVASVMEVETAQVPRTGEDGESEGSWSLVPIGGDQVGTRDPSEECRGVVDGNSGAPAFWLFSGDACGAYGLGDLQILHSGHTAPVGEVTLTANGKAVKVGRGSAMLLRVDGSGPQEAQAPAMPSRGAAQ
jgi:hypothetical protein